MAGSNLSFVIAIKFFTESFNKGAAKVKASLLSLQRQFITLTAALGAGSLGFSNLLSRMVNTAKETSRVNVALKNVSKSTAEFVEHQKWLLDLSKRYGVEINALTSGFTKFKAAADVSNMSLDDQRKIFESVSRAAVGFGLSADDQRGVFMALAQMMSKGKVMAEELRLQMGERMPVALQAMAEAAGTNIEGLETMMKQGRVLSADVLPKFADALTRMIPNVDTDNLNKSLTDLRNVFTNIVKDANIEGHFKWIVEQVTSLMQGLANNIKGVGELIKVGLAGALGKGLVSIWQGMVKNYEQAVSFATKKIKGGQNAIKRAAQAEDAYNTAVADHAKALEAQRTMSKKASAEERLAIEARVAQAAMTLEERKTAHYKAQEKLKRVEAKATAHDSYVASMSTATGWQRALNVVEINASRALATLRQLFFSNLWTAALAAVGVLGKKLYDLVRDTYKLKNAAKEMASVEATPEMKELDRYKDLIRSKDDSVRAGAIEKINQLLGTQLSEEEDINKAVETRLKLLNAEVSLKKAEDLRDTAAKQTALKRKDGIGSNSYKEALANEAERQAEVDYWNREIARLTSIEKSYGGDKLFPGGGKKAKVEIPVVLKVEDIETLEAQTPDLSMEDINMLPANWRDKSRDWKLTDTEILEADLEQAKKYLDELSAYANTTGENMQAAIKDQMGKIGNLEEAFRLAELAEAAKDVQKELGNTKLDFFTDSVDNIDSLVNAFARLNEVMEEDGNAWERIMAVWGAFKSASESVISTIETINKIKELEAQQTQINAQKNIGAAQGEAVANATKEGSKMPFPYNIVAIATAIGAVMSAFAMIPKFANGGVVGGNSTSGDKILARLNSGEGVLTRTGMGTLYNMMQGGNGGLHVSGEFKVKGRDLVAAIDQNTKFKNRTK